MNMQHDFFYENQIANGSVQFIKKISTDLDTIQIVFQDIKDGSETRFEVVGFNNCSIVLDFPENINILHSSYIQQTLIGLSFEEIDNLYKYCLKTDDYEIMCESPNLPKIVKD